MAHLEGLFRGRGNCGSITLPKTGAKAARQVALSTVQSGRLRVIGCSNVVSSDRVLYWKLGDSSVDCTAPGGAADPDGCMAGWGAGEIATNETAAGVGATTHVCFYAEVDFAFAYCEGE